MEYKVMWFKVPSAYIMLKYVNKSVHQKKLALLSYVVCSPQAYATKIVQTKSSSESNIVHRGPSACRMRFFGK